MRHHVMVNKSPPATDERERMKAERSQFSSVVSNGKKSCIKKPYGTRLLWRTTNLRSLEENVTTNFTLLTPHANAATKTRKFIECHLKASHHADLFLPSPNCNLPFFFVFRMTIFFVLKMENFDSDSR